MNATNSSCNFRYLIHAVVVSNSTTNAANLFYLQSYEMTAIFGIGNSLYAIIGTVFAMIALW